MEKEKSVANAEPPAPLQLTDGIKSKQEKGKFTGLSFLNREKTSDRSVSMSSGSNSSLNPKPRKTFFTKTSKTNLQ